MKIKIPAGLQLDVQPGQETELLAKVLVTKDGYLKLETLDGKPVTDEGSDKENEEDENEEAQETPDQESQETPPDQGDEGGENDSESAAPGADQDQSQGGEAPASTGSPEVDQLLSQIGNAAPAKGKAKHAVVTAQSPEEYFKKRQMARKIAKKK
jgi:hypothetical protein